MNAAIRLSREEEHSMISVSLGLVQLCCESSCQEIFHLSDARCPKCGSIGMPLQRLLDQRGDYSQLVTATKTLLRGPLTIRQRGLLADALKTAGVAS